MSTARRARKRGAYKPRNRATIRFRYKEQFGVIVVCRDARHQEHVYTDLTRRGHRCKVVVV